MDCSVGVEAGARSNVGAVFPSLPHACGVGVLVDAIAVTNILSIVFQVFSPCANDPQGWFL